MWAARLMAAWVVVWLMLTASATSQVLTFGRDDYASQSGARAIVTADFDRNGWPDVAHANAGRNSVTILLNHRDRALTRAFDVPVGAGPFDLTTGDYNRDGIPDLAVANADGHSISVLLGRGTGAFARNDMAAPSQNPRGITTADVNSDGKPDLIYSAYATRTVQVLVGDGAGGFTRGVAYVGSPANPQGLAAADFNQDGRVDLALAYASGGGLRILYNDRGTSFFGRSVSGTTSLNVVVAADFNSDGWSDVAAASTSNSTVAIYMGSATGMVHARSYATGASPRGIAAADLNQDGAVDVITANRGSNTVSVLLGDVAKPGTFLPHLVVAAASGSRAVAVSDFNLDGLLDLATGNEYASSVTLLSNETVLKRAAYTFSQELRIPTGAWSAAAARSGNSGPVTADFNRDGRPDVASRGRVGESDVATVAILTTGTVRLLAGLDPTAGVIAGDFNNDGSADVLAHLEESANLPGGVHTRWLTHRGDGRGGFAASPMTESTYWLFLCKAADMNRDGRLDLACTGHDERTSLPILHVMTGRGDGTFQPGAAVTPAAAGASDLDIADVNGDGAADVLVLHGDVEIWLGDGAGGLSNAGTISASMLQYPSTVRTADLNHDGRLDVVIADLYTGLGIALATSDGFADLAFVPLAVPITYFDVADVNVDGHADLIGGWGQILLGAGDGTFGAPQNFAFDTTTPADFNHDGLLDFVAPRGEELRVVLNERNDANQPPAVVAPDATFDYQQVRHDCASLRTEASDPDRHALTFEWRDPSGVLVSTTRSVEWCANEYGTYAYELKVADGRGAIVTETVLLSFVPSKEIVLHAMQDEAYWLMGHWLRLADPGAAGGFRAYDSGVGSLKVSRPSANPANTVQLEFAPDPTQTYKLWVRLKADNNHWANDSVWVQFSGSTDVSGTPKYRIGTTSGLAVNLEECSGCGLSGWGWEDDGWGAVNRNGVLLRFPDGGIQHILVQTREDGVSIDQVVLSAQTYLTARPGAAKNDTTILPKTYTPSPY